MSGMGIAGVVEAHWRGDWSDRTYSCGGCAQRVEDEAQARFDAMDREPTWDELVAFLNEHRLFNHPGWSGEEYANHLAQAIAAHLAEVVGGLRDPIADAIHANDCGCPDWHADDQEDVTYREHADAVLAVVTEALTGGAR